MVTSHPDAHPDVLIRPLRADDVAAAERLTSLSYHQLDLRTRPAEAPAPEPREGAASANWQRRVHHLLRTDPGGCWVADADGELVGVAVGGRRELLWFLASYAVHPAWQGQGLGRALFAAAMQHRQGCLRAMLTASPDPRALRLYRQAGFTLHPQLLLRGQVDRTALPTRSRVREGGPDDRDLLDSVDRGTRGAAHGVDHELLTGEHRLVVADGATGSGYAYLADQGGPVLLGATNRRTAAALLWEALAATPPGVPVEVARVTAANEWAVDVGLAAGLEIHQRGYLALSHLKPPVPYLHHPTLL